MAAALEDRAGRTTRLGLKPLQGCGRAGDRFQNDEVFRLEIVVVLGIGDGARADLRGTTARTACACKAGSP